MLSRTLTSLFTAAAVGGGILAAPAQAVPAPLTQGEAREESPGPVAGRSYYILAGTTESFAPLRADLPAGTILSLDEGAELEALRSDGWSIIVADNVMTVTAPRHAEYRYEIPVLVSYPDGTREAAVVVMDVDYLVETSLIRLSAREIGKLSS